MKWRMYKSYWNHDVYEGINISDEEMKCTIFGDCWNRF